MFHRALIPAAGRGLRAYPKTGRIAKVLLEIDGKPLILRNIELLRTAWGFARSRSSWALSAIRCGRGWETAAGTA